MGLAAGLLVGVTQVGFGISEGRRAQKAEEEAMRRQEIAQQRALAQSRREERRVEQERKRLNRRSPEVDTVLARERDLRSAGPAGTLLTSSRGVSPASVALGRRNSLLGGGGS